MGAVSKTETLERITLPIGALERQSLNPNKMKSREFNLLCDNMEKVGFVDPVFVRRTEEGKYRIIGGHHRVEAAELLGFEEVPCTVIDGEGYTEDWEQFQVVRMNMIKGELDPQAFLQMYEGLSKTYEAEIMAEAFGFADDKAFEKLISQMTKSVPKERRADFKKAAKDIKTIDGLTKLLNSMFTEHGDELPYGYMIVDFGGHESIWIQLEKTDHKNFDRMVSIAKENGKGIDSLFKTFISKIADGELAEVIAEATDI